MAKKKMTHQSKDAEPKPQEPAEAPPQLPHHRQGADSATTISAASTASAAMDGSSDKLQSLKSLNARLLKETVDGRRQIDALVQEKKSLETELARASQERKALEGELARAGEEGVRSAVERGVVRVFLESQIGMMESLVGSLRREMNQLLDSLEKQKGELVRVCEERDLLKIDFFGLVKEAEGLKDRERLVKEEVEKLGAQCDGLIEEKEGRERLVQGLKKEKCFVETKLADLEGAVVRLKGENDRVSRERDEVERARSGLKVRIGVLEKELGAKDEVAVGLRGIVEALRARVWELEKFIGEGMEEMGMEVRSLKEEKAEKEKRIEELELRFCEAEAGWKRSSVEANEKGLWIEELIREKSEIEAVRVVQESEIVKLSNEVGELRDALFELRNLCRDLEESNRKLVADVGNYKDALERVTLETNEARRAFDEERKNVEDLKLVVSEKEKRVEEIRKELCVLRDVNESLVEKTEATESRLESLVKERDLAQKSLLEAESRMEEWRVKVESASINSERALKMLKKTASMVSASQPEHGKQESINDEQKLEDEIQPYFVELEAIHNAFRNKEKIVEDMKQQVEALKHSANEANKRKSFWTLVSSATTLFAAAFVAYVAKAR